MTALAVFVGMSALTPLQSGEQPGGVDPNPASLAIPDEVDARARTLVEQLGNRDFTLREEAQRELRELGRLALPALEDGWQESPVPEVVERCEQILPAARAVDLRARVDCFTADVEGKYDHQMPGAKQFFAITGRSAAARKLFRDLLLSENRGLIVGVDGSQQDLARLAVARRVELYPRGTVVVGGVVQRPKQATPPDIAALLFAESTFPEKLLTEFGMAGGIAVNSPTVLLSQSTFRTALTTGEMKEPLVAITSRWCETREDLRTIYSGMSVAASLNLPVAVTMAKKMLTTKTATPLYKAMAAGHLARFGKPDDLKVLAPLLTDETQAYAGVTTVVNGVQTRSPIRVQDVALAMSLLMTGQKPTDYGMKSRYAANTNVNVTAQYSYTNYHFDNTDDKADDRRAEAFKKWKEWKAKQGK